MTLLHSQVGEAIEWKSGGRQFKWQPYAAVEVPIELVAPLRAQKFPVSEVPVTPERKAAAIAESEQLRIRADEVNTLRNQLTLARADVDAARQEVCAAEERREASEQLAESMAAKSRSLENELASARLDLKAAEELIREQTQKLEVSGANGRPAKQKSEAKQASP
jgi:chromosome segregation ATPase